MITFMIIIIIIIIIKIIIIIIIITLINFIEIIISTPLLSFLIGCIHLKEIRLARCLYVSDESVRAIAKGCPKLHTIYLNNCSSITDSCIVALARGERMFFIRVRSLNKQYHAGCFRI